jgi:hypothetical protein
MKYARDSHLSTSFEIVLVGIVGCAVCNEDRKRTDPFATMVEGSCGTAAKCGLAAESASVLARIIIVVCDAIDRLMRSINILILRIIL